MLIIPFDRRIDWSHPPVVTLLLILINFILYFGWQSNDDQRLVEALAYYQKSGLAELERTAYEQRLKTEGKALPPVFRTNGKDGKETPPVWALSDNDFMRAAKRGRLMAPAAPGYEEWRAKRAEFERLLSRVVLWEHGLKTDVFNPPELLSHMFLHAGFMHLFGNMFFLLAVGFLVERTFGSGAYLAAYLLAGMGGAAFDFIFTPDRLIAGSGASGAVSGLMGMYAVLFWTRPIRFFYFLFVIFGFAQLPAIILLPLWVGEQLYQLFAYPHSNINYLAHVGGLVTGAAIALGVRNYLPSFSLGFADREDDSADFERRLAEATDLCKALEYRKARPILALLHARNPEDERVLRHLHQCSRMEPDKEEYHRLSRKILSLRQYDESTNQWVLASYREYLQRAKPNPRLDRPLMTQLAQRFIKTGHLKEAEPLIAHFLKKGDASEETLRLAALLGERLVQRGEGERGGKYLALVARLKS